MMNSAECYTHATQAWLAGAQAGGILATIALAPFLVLITLVLYHSWKARK